MAILDFPDRTKSTIGSPVDELGECFSECPLRPGRGRNSVITFSCPVLSVATLNPRSLVRTIFPTAHRRLVNAALKSASGSFDRVLVIGAGADPYQACFVGRKRYVRLDMDNLFGTTDVVGNACALPFVDSSFDCLVATELLEHLSSPKAFVEEAIRVLRPDGVLIATVPFMYHIHGDPDDYQRLTESGLRRLFTSFSSVSIRGLGNRLHVLSDLILTSRWLRYPLFPLRALNHLLMARVSGTSSAPSGYLCIAKKEPT